jgi:hypothetical protein
MPDGLSMLDRSDVLACDGRAAHYVAGWLVGYELDPVSACPWPAMTMQRMMWGAGYYMGRGARIRITLIGQQRRAAARAAARGKL